MKKLLQFLVLLFTLDSMMADAQQSSAASRVFEISSPSIVKVFVTDNEKTQQGSGVVFLSIESVSISNFNFPARSRIVTNAHVIGMGKGIKVISDDKEYAGKLTGLDDELDLAIIDIEGVTLPAAKLVSAQALPKIGSSVFAIGSPLGLDKSITSGLISAIRKNKDVILLQISAPISPGSSGGGLFDARGELLGITTSKLIAGEGIGFAVYVSHLDELKDVSLASRLLGHFATSHLGRYLGISELDGKAIQESRQLFTWLRTNNDSNGRPLYKVVPEKSAEAFQLFSDRKEFEALKEKRESAGQVLLSIAKQFLSTLKSSTNGNNLSNAIHLGCEFTSPDGKKDYLSFTVDLVAGTVNGDPAIITNDEISWDNFTVDRHTGLLVMSGEYSAKCTPRANYLF